MKGGDEVVLKQGASIVALILFFTTAPGFLHQRPVARS